VLAVVTTSSSGAASYSASALTAGYHSITARGRDANVQAGVFAVLTETVQSPDTLSLTATGPVTYGQPVTLTATVFAGAATGTFQFSDGGSNYGTIAISSGQAAVTVPSLNAGNHLIAAGYSGTAFTSLVRPRSRSTSPKSLPLLRSPRPPIPRP